MKGGGGGEPLQPPLGNSNHDLLLLMDRLIGQTLHI